MNKRPATKNQKGFSLFEFVVVMTVIGIISGLGAMLFSSAFQGYFESVDLIGADWQANLALEYMQRDIRSVRSPADIITATSSQLTFVEADTNNTSSYSLSGTTLQNTINSGAALPLAYGVSSLTFSYFDRNGTITSVLANIRYITIRLNITLNNTNFIATTSVYTRNSP